MSEVANLYLYIFSRIFSLEIILIICTIILHFTLTLIETERSYYVKILISKYLPTTHNGFCREIYKFMQNRERVADVSMLSTCSSTPCVVRRREIPAVRKCVCTPGPRGKNEARQERSRRIKEHYVLRSSRG